MKTAYLILFIRPSPCGTVGCTAHRAVVERAQIASAAPVAQTDMELQQAVMLEVTAADYGRAHAQLSLLLESERRYKWVLELLR